MTYLFSDNIISPLACGTEHNLQTLLAGKSALRYYTDLFAPVEPFCASMFDKIECVNFFSPFESLCIKAVQGLQPTIQKDVLSSKDTIFVISTTKGNIAYLEERQSTDTRMTDDLLLATSARKISAYFGNSNTPIVVSNACISGVCAIITAQRLLETGSYRHAVVIGADVLSKFIVSGFQSFKALSPTPCHPFDAERKGLNLGEAAAAVLLSSAPTDADNALGSIEAGSIHNDANHISGPSRTGEGSFLCLKDVMPENTDDLAFINVHGTATAYNDEMESIAITRAGLQDVPVNGLKGVFGHTLGAAGLLETILSLHALREGVILPTRGYYEQGTTYKLNLSSAHRHTNKQQFIKLLSGFGGCNAAIRVTTKTKEDGTRSEEQGARNKEQGAKNKEQVIAEIRINRTEVVLNGKKLPTTEQGEHMLTELYRTHLNDYPKFFKMDTLSRLGFVASELLLQSIGETRFVGRSDRAIIFANRSASLKNDADYQRTISDAGNYYPSPALFVYTLPNIVTGEVAIRNKYFGETSFYVLDDEEQLQPLIEATLSYSDVNSAIVGWLECTPFTDNTTDDNTPAFEAHLKIIIRQ